MAKRPEARTNFLGIELRLFPSGEMRAFGKLVVMNEMGVRLLCPTAGGGIDLAWKGAHGYGNGDAFDVEEAFFRRAAVVPIKTGRRDSRIRQPVERDVVEDVIRREPFGLAVEHARKKIIA